MTIEAAFEELISSEAFKTAAKGRDTLGNKYRTYVGRYRRGELRTGAMVEILLSNGYEVKANKVRKK